MSRVITFSRKFPSYHPKAGALTYFIESIYMGLEIDYDEVPIPVRRLVNMTMKFYPKRHTIRKGSRWKVGDKFSPRIWSDKPYRSGQIIIAPDIEIKQIYDIEIAIGLGGIKINGEWHFSDFNKLINKLAMNDGLSVTDFKAWFNTPSFIGQIICWDDQIKYP